LLVALCTFTSAIVHAEPVDSPILPGRYYVGFQATTRYLDVYGVDPSAGAALQIWQKVGGPNQIWEFIQSPEKSYYYVRSDMGRYLDVRAGGTAAGTPVQMWDFNGTNAQKWRVQQESGVIILRSRLGTYLRTRTLADSNGNVVETGPLLAGRAGWRMEPAEVLPGTYLIKSALAARYLDVYTANPAGGTPLQIWQKAGGPNQKWEIIPSGEPSYFFFKSELGRYLDVRAGVSTSGAIVQIWDFNGSDAQKWRVEPQGDGQVALRSRLGTYLDVQSGGTTNGTPVVTASSAVGAARRWSLEPIVSTQRLHGWADLHTHPMSHLGFGKKLMHGVPDVGSLIPAGTRDCNPVDLRATSIDQALGHCNSTHGGWGTDNTCGDYVRATIVSQGLDDGFVHRTSHVHPDHQHEGYPNLPFWPHQTSVTHQQMWWEWIKRAHLGGLRALVALAVNTELLGTIINGDAPLDDRSSATLQIEELKSFVGRHADFMEVALSAADYRRIVGAGKLAVILGVEIDNIGNFNRSSPSELTVRSELQRLHASGVRYIFPIHVVDNKFGGAAVYEDLFSYANRYSTGEPYSLASAADPSITLRLAPDNWWMRPVLDAVSTVPYPPAFNLFSCPTAVIGCWDQFQRINSLLQPDPRTAVYATIPGGHVNARGLTPLGERAVADMMRMGMLIDVDHMSERSMVRTAELAEWLVPGGYPLILGHNGVRDASGSERSVSESFARRVGRLGGMFGVGTSDTSPADFIAAYRRAYGAIGGRAAALGSDANGMEPLPRASAGLSSAAFYDGFPKSRTGNREWDYTVEGAAHYGLMWDFLRDVERQPNGPAVVGALYGSAESFAQTWERAERLAPAARPR
jgi:microsomal dipeptidase-like Zn-dependent dipeptidase